MTAHLLPTDVSRLLTVAWRVAMPGAAFLPLLGYDGTETAMLIGTAVSVLVINSHFTCCAPHTPLKIPICHYTLSSKQPHRCFGGLMHEYC